MKAVLCEQYGPPEELGERLVVREIPDPVPGDGEVVVDVAAAAVNFADVLFVADRYQVSVPVPFIPGSEFAGTVSAVGPGARGVQVGDRVAGRTRSEEHTSELQSRENLVCRLLLEKKKITD